MDPTRIVEILTNSGLVDVRVDEKFIYFLDPSCIFPAFDIVLHYAWIVCLVLTAMILFGWGVLYIKNGVKLDSLFKNVKSLLLIFGVLSVVIPIINFISNNNLFGQMCEKKQVSLSSVQELLAQRDKHFSNSNMNSFFDDFTVIDSGVILPPSDSDYFGTENTTGTGQNDELNTNSPSNVTVFRNRNGELYKHTNGSRSWRNNNPGNMRASSGLIHGANGISDGFLVFPDVETGLNAISKLFKSKNYISLTLAGAMQRYAPSADNNNPERYAKNISQRTGISVNAKIKDLSDSELKKIALAIQQIECWNVGIEEKL